MQIPFDMEIGGVKKAIKIFLTLFTKHTLTSTTMPQENSCGEISMKISV